MNRQMTEEERALVEENRKLVYFVLHKHFWCDKADWEDYVQIGMLGLCYAAMGWKPEKAEFSTYASVCIEMKVRKWVRYRHAERRDIRKEAYSLDDVLPGKEQITFADVIPDSRRVEDGMERWMLQNALDKLRYRDRQMVDLMLCGKTQSQIGDELGLSQGYVARCLQRIARQLREEMSA